MEFQDENLIICEMTAMLNSSKNMNEVINNLNRIDNVINNSKKKRVLIQKFLENLDRNMNMLVFLKKGIKSSKGIEYSKIIYYPEAESYSVLVGYYMGSLGYKPTIKAYKEMYKVTKECLLEYNAPTINDYDVLTKEQIEEIFDLPIVSFTLKVTSNERHLRILNFNLVSPVSNSLYIPFGNIIINSRLKHQAGHGNESITVFLHELGHALHFNITQNIDIFPEKFTDLFEKVTNNSWDIVLEEHRQDVFADFFAVAACLDTTYEGNNSLIKLLTREATQQIKDYFNNIITGALTK